MNEQSDVIIIGSGHSGLAIGYCLAKKKQNFIILEKSNSIVPAWRSRWDSFTLVLPNWTLQLPDYHYSGTKPDGFLTRDEVVQYMESFAATFKPDIRFNSEVIAVEKSPTGPSFLVRTPEKIYEANNVVVATGTFQTPKIPGFHRELSGKITQLHSSEYRNPGELPQGAVLVVGSGQSGCQIAEELYKAGRKVYLCVGDAKRLPRTYRGKDSIVWLKEMGFFDMTVDNLPSPRDKFAANPFLTGSNGGRSLNLHQFAKDGVILLGRMQDAEGDRISLAETLKKSLTDIDKFVTEVKGNIDKHIEMNGIEAEEAPSKKPLDDGFESEIINELDLGVEGINTIIWATGYKFDYRLAKFPVLDDDGYPVQTRGVSEIPGLYFIGMHFLYKRRSGLPWGIAEDAGHIADHIAAR